MKLFIFLTIAALPIGVLADDSMLSQQNFYKIIDSVGHQKQIDAVVKANKKAGVKGWEPETREGEKADEKNKLELSKAIESVAKIKRITNWQCNYLGSPEDLIAQLADRKTHAEVYCNRFSVTPINKDKMEYRLELSPEVATKVKKIYRGDKLIFSGEPRSITGIGRIEIFAIIAVDSMQISK
jgi:hypothetical protein